MRKFIPALFLFVLYIDLNGQVIHENIAGQVSFVSSQNIYVKFKSTDGISSGDTLFIQSSGSIFPVLIVTNMSSSSCVCSKISATNISVADNIIAIVNISNKKAAAKDIKNSGKTISIPMTDTIPASSDAKNSTQKISAANELKQRIRGSTSLNSYTDNSNTSTPNSQRFRYTFSIDASNIANSKFSFENYLSFKYKTGEWEEVKNNVFSVLKIFSLAVRYNPDNTTQISMGRRINPKISSIGASDGIQIEKTISRFALGALAGTRPDYEDYGFNSKLFQYGGYLAFNTKSANTYSESSLAFMQQMNNSKTDRRFLYFQHSNSIIKNLNLFSTFEVDLYELKIDTINNTEQQQNTFSLTGLYLSLSYRIGKSLYFSGSYDARKNVMYYETFKTYVERILENETRQGYIFHASYRFSRNITLGLQSGYRFLKSDPHTSKNLYGYLSYSQIPGVNMSATLSATLLETGYINGNIYGLTFSHDFFKGKVQTSIGYRYVDYTLPENQLSVPQNVAEMNLSWQFARNMSFSLNYEGTFEKQDKYNRTYLQIRKRF
jgi:hypothetical protein